MPATKSLLPQSKGIPSRRIGTASASKSPTRRLNSETLRTHAVEGSGAGVVGCEMLPAPLDSVMKRTGFVGLRIGETGAPLEIDDEFQRLGGGIEVAGNDLPWGCESECLGEKVFNSHGHKTCGHGRRNPARKPPPSQFELRKVTHKVNRKGKKNAASAIEFSRSAGHYSLDPRLSLIFSHPTFLE